MVTAHAPASLGGTFANPPSGNMQSEAIKNYFPNWFDKHLSVLSVERRMKIMKPETNDAVERLSRGRQ